MLYDDCVECLWDLRLELEVVVEEGSSLGLRLLLMMLSAAIHSRTFRVMTRLVVRLVEFNIRPVIGDVDRT